MRIRGHDGRGWSQMKKKTFQIFIESFSLTKVAFMEQYNAQGYIQDLQH
jgi:hypothetical protein